MIPEFCFIGDVSTLAGGRGFSIQGHADGYGTTALFNNPQGLNINKNGIVYVCDRSNNVIRKILTSGKLLFIQLLA